MQLSQKVSPRPLQDECVEEVADAHVHLEQNEASVAIELRQTIVGQAFKELVGRVATDLRVSHSRGAAKLKSC